MLLPSEGPLDSKTQEFRACVPGSHSLAYPPAPSAQTGVGPGVAPGPGAELRSLCSCCTNTWSPPARQAWAGRPLRAAQTGRDGTRAAAPHLSRAAFPDAPPGVGWGGGAPQKPVGHCPLPAAVSCCRSPERQQVLPWGASHGPTTPISHTSNTSCLCLGQGTSEGQSQRLVEALYPL